MSVIGLSRKSSRTSTSTRDSLPSSDAYTPAARQAQLLQQTWDTKEVCPVPGTAGRVGKSRADVAFAHAGFAYDHHVVLPHASRRPSREPLARRPRVAFPSLSVMCCP